MGTALLLLQPNKEKGHALDTAVDDWGTDSCDHPDLVLYALRTWGRCAALSRRKAALTDNRGLL